MTTNFNRTVQYMKKNIRKSIDNQLFRKTFSRLKKKIDRKNHHNAMSDEFKKVCFAASSGGHYEQLLMLKPLMEKYNSFIITEQTAYVSEIKGRKSYYLKQVNRKEYTFIPNMIINTFISLWIYINEKPDAIICTGVLATIPICIIAKIFGKKLIYIESFAKVTSATETGKLLYRFADQFYVQWEDMVNIYPNAINKGGIY